MELRRTYHHQLDELTSDVARLAAMASEAIQAGTKALLEFDIFLAERVVVDDAALDQLTDSIEERVYNLMALQQPMARDLR
ncbi:MAG: PhoU domain-containing protein, partial [Pseudonocardiaceae bacterium]